MKIAIISDIHANIFALNAFLKKIEKDNIEIILVAGDIVGYYYWPKEVVSILMSDSRFICIRGNHEEILYKVLYEPELAEKFRKKYGSGYDICKTKLSTDELEWLLALPKSKCIKYGGKSFYLCHGGLEDVNKYIYPDKAENLIIENYSNCDFTIFGHTHYPFMHQYKEKKMLNPGSLGQPRDIGGIASFVIVDLINNIIQFKRVPFDKMEIIEVAKINDPDLNYLVNVMER